MEGRGRPADDHQTTESRARTLRSRLARHTPHLLVRALPRPALHELPRSPRHQRGSRAALARLPHAFARQHGDHLVRARGGARASRQPRERLDHRRRKPRAQAGSGATRVDPGHRRRSEAQRSQLDVGRRRRGERRRAAASGCARPVAFGPVRACVTWRAEPTADMDAIIAVLTRYGYWVIFGTVFAEQIGLPIPAIPVLLAAGALVGTDHLDEALA